MGKKTHKKIRKARRKGMALSMDVLVVGGGAAGIAAATAAADNGARVLLVDRRPLLSGRAGTGMVGSLRGTASSGLFTRIQSISTRAWGRLLFDPEELKALLIEQVLDRSISVLCSTQVTSLVVEDRRILGAWARTAEDEVLLEAQTYIDATGEGLLAELADVPRIPPAGQEQAVLAVQVGGLNMHKMASLAGQDLSYWLDGANPCLYRIELTPGVRGGTGLLSFFWDTPPLADLCAQAQAKLRSIGQIGSMVSALRHMVDGCEDMYIIRIIDDIGRVGCSGTEGREILNREDVARGRVFEDWAVSRAFYDDAKQGYTQPFTVPMGCLRARRIKNLLLTGASLSVEAEVAPCVATLPMALATGQAAGTMAALARNGSLKRLAAEDLQRCLLAQGVLAPSPQAVQPGPSPILSSPSPAPIPGFKDPEPLP